MNEFLPLTDQLLPDEAWRALEEALRPYGLHVEDLDPERDVVIDSYRNEQGETLHRYSVRRTRLEPP